MKKIIQLMVCLLSMNMYGNNSNASLFCQSLAEKEDSVTLPPTDTLCSFEQELMMRGFAEITADMSDSAKIKVGKPACAYINITGVERMPSLKNENMHAWLDVYCGDGVRFRKRAIINAQGNSSLQFPKKNFKVDLCNDEWIGDSTVNVSIGDWVAQDGFHFKAYYTDWLRGVAVVSLQIYDEMATEVGRAWTRAGKLEKSKEKARCYVDGFPCIVYLNGEFYGIFSWQLSKHRDNMNQKKSTAEHVHLDGQFSNMFFFCADNIDWTQFEVRNPKHLYAMDGTAYDGDNPQELMDETSPFYDVAGDSADVIKDKQRTAQVKNYIVGFTTACKTLYQMEKEQKPSAEIRSYFEEHFDVTSLIDYQVHAMVTNNYDGFWKNWQWFTYDGKKWFVTPYDLDCTFGNFASGNFVMPADWSWFSHHAIVWQREGPFKFISNYYQQEVVDRYCHLRDAGILSAATIKDKLNDWYGHVADYMEREWKRWPDSKCISETVCSEGWSLEDWTYRQILPDYNDTITYRPEDRCVLKDLVWKATAETKGVRPYVSLGYTDSLERYEQWIEQRISLLDEGFGYQQVEELPVLLPQQSDRSNSPIAAIYNLSGLRQSAIQPGINIVVYKDGTVRKILK